MFVVVHVSKLFNFQNENSSTATSKKTMLVYYPVNQSSIPVNSSIKEKKKKTVEFFSA